MNEEVKAILGNSITIEDKEIPIEHLKYTGDSKTYITWTLLDEIPELFGNDEPLYSVCPLDIDVYSDDNYLSIIKEIKKKMKANEWIWSEDSVEMLDDDTGLYHKTITFEKERMIENG